MSFNVLDLVKGQLSDQLTGQMGSYLGLNEQAMGKAMSGALPGLLSGIASKASTAEGAGSVIDALGQADDNALGGLASMMGSNPAAIVNQGQGMLSAILGNNGLSSLAGVVGSFAGLKGNGGGSLLALIAPFAIKALKSHFFAGGQVPNVAAFADTMKSQQGLLQQAMPQEFATQLNASGLLGNVSAAAETATASVSNAVDSAAAAAPKSGGGIGKMAIPAVVAAGLGVLGFNHFSGEKAPSVDTSAVENVVAEGQAAASGAAEQVSNLAGDAASKLEGVAGDAAAKVEEAVSNVAGDAAGKVEGALGGLGDVADLGNLGDLANLDPSKLGETLTGSFGQLSESLGGITDVDSAKAALPGLEAVSGQFGQLSGVLDKLPTEAMGPLKGVISQGGSTVSPMIEKLLAIPGVGDILKPVIGPITDFLAKFGG